MSGTDLQAEISRLRLRVQRLMPPEQRQQQQQQQEQQQQQQQLLMTEKEYQAERERQERERQAERQRQERERQQLLEAEQMAKVLEARARAVSGLSAQAEKDLSWIAQSLNYLRNSFRHEQERPYEREWPQQQQQQ